MSWTRVAILGEPATRSRRLVPLPKEPKKHGLEVTPVQCAQAGVKAQLRVDILADHQHGVPACLAGPSKGHVAQEEGWQGLRLSKNLIKSQNRSLTSSFKSKRRLGPAALNGRDQGPPPPHSRTGLPWETAGPNQVQKDLSGRGSPVPQPLPRACQIRILSRKTQQPSSL